MSKQQIIDEQIEELRALRRYVADLKNRHDIAIDALAMLAAGYGHRKENGEYCMKELAKNKLASIAKMPLREAP